MKNERVLIAGGGIGGLATALALVRTGQRVTVLERTAEFAEIGAGIQLGPNSMQILASWGLLDAILAEACLPEAIVMRDVHSGRSLSRLLLGRAVLQRYGQVYACVHRADLHAVLLQAVRNEPGIELVCNAMVNHVNREMSNQSPDAQDAVEVQAAGRAWQADALVAADGVWSSVRPAVFGDGVPRATGHAAYRALVPMARVPATLQTNEVGVWWGRDMHVVHYPVRRGAFLNLVVLSEQCTTQALPGWTQEVSPEAIAPSLRGACTELRSLLECASAAAQDRSVQSASLWQSWHLYDRPAARSWVQGRIALLGDAAHPMLPYLAQGAAMALEDAAVLAGCVAAHSNWATALQQYQHQRKSRCERVVATARRNGQIFHMAMPWSLARDAVLALKGTEVLGMPWLYGARIGSS
ncbi:MAG: FAD-dependent monooxygenase [Burkholderiaceae bacterium]